MSQTGKRLIKSGRLILSISLNGFRLFHCNNDVFVHAVARPIMYTEDAYDVLDRWP